MSSKMKRAELAKELGAALTQLGKDLEVDGESYNKVSYDNVRERLAKLLAVDEVFGLVRLVAEDRMRCRGCGRNVFASRVRGGLCRGCGVPWTAGEGAAQ